MKFHKQGYPSLIIVLLFSIILNGIIYFFLNDFTIIKWLGYAISAFLIIVILQFFRSPIRNFAARDKEIISPADGKVVVIEEVMETEYFNEKRLQVSVFMSPINVHLNRYPISGVLKYFKYHSGKYLVAWHPKASTENERTTIVVEDSQGRAVLFRQIAGALAKRIVFFGKENTDVKQTDECGFIKFGSRVDLLLPLDVELNVKLNDKVKGGISTIAKFK
ncbi:MAG: phosphatidylserine decarboxylase family protein [Flavobacteriales bacterium]|nr:phosphatidylserine decarboxylase family protein [Flavobacteriales bacterium]MCW8913221.1 phosphatidylserine decarboxylase family protein [Flavobacteriales bacterium]MCW8936807.1 phosphatidylserine decarboxylase family protein [Flavobacteriales bacterium]MCW8941238.1 phosphatidylserine decarboxylase family protein [Flavobacteriales bacterium]MCW8968647.1 phosphatidylserine decarboxylase family protein [Flavobacteriales bacterium]